MTSRWSRANVLRPLAGLEIAFLVAAMCGALFTPIAGLVFQPVVQYLLDYTLPWILAGIVLATWHLYRRAKLKDMPDSERPRLSLAPLAVAFLVGWWTRPTLLAVNALLDRSPVHQFAGIVTGVSCSGRGASAWRLVGAPVLPTPNDSMRIPGAGCGDVEGDSVVIEVKRGFLGRPWIASYHLSGPDATTMELLRRHRALQHNARGNPVR